MKKILAILGTLGLVATSATTVIACSTYNLASKSIKQDLGVLDWDGRPETAVPEDKTIIDAFNRVNKGILKENISSDNVTISNKTRNSALITASDQNKDLNGKTQVRYSLTNRGETDLGGSQDKGVVLRNLGEINHATTGDNWILASDKDVLDGFLSTNEFLFKNGMQLGTHVDVTNKTSTSATIKARDGQTEFTGEVSVTFTTKRSEFDLKLTEYKFKPKTTIEKIIEKIKTDNSTLKIDDLVLSASEIKDNHGTVSVTVKDGSTFYSPLSDPIIISFDIEKFDFKAPGAFNNFKNTKFDFNETDEDVIKEFKKQYENEKIGGEKIDFDELDIKADLETKKITIDVKDGSTIYTKPNKPLEVQFTMKTVAETKLTTIKIEGNGKNPIPGEEVLKQINLQFKRPLEMNDDIQEIIINDGKTNATIKLNSKYGQDASLSVGINFNDTRQKLEDVIKIKDLGELEDNKLETVKATIDAKYPGLTSENGITVTVENNTAKVSAKDSEKYQDATITLTFTTKEARSKLEDVITDTNLGELEDNKLETVKAAIDAKYPGLTSETGITVVVNANNTATITAKDSPKYLDGNITLSFTIKDHRSKLEDVITDTNLGEIDDNKLETVKAAIDAKYPGLTSETGITVVVNANNTATITAKDSPKYLDGNVTLTFTIKDHRLKLSDVITNTDLGSVLDVESILRKIEEDFGLIHGQDGITITVHLLQGRLTITAKDSKKYLDGSIDLTFRLHRESLEDVIKIKDLGELDDNKLETVKAAIDAKYPGLTSETGITVVVNANNTVTITAKDSPKYLDGNVTLSFTIKDHRSKLEDVITDTNLGVLNDNKLETVKAAIDAKYPGLTSETGITVVVNANNTVTITAKDSLKYLDGTITLTFTIKDGRLSLDEVVPNKDLGPVKNAQVVFNKIAEDFGLITGMDGITIEVRVPENIAIITAKDSLKYLDGTITLTFTVIDNRIRLDETITDTNLGELDDNKLETVKAAIDAKYPGLTSETGITVVVNTERLVTITAKDSTKYLDGIIYLTYTIKDHRLKLSDVITNTDLGSILNATAVLRKIEDDFGLVHEVDGITIDVRFLQERVIITAKDSPKYQDGTITLTFTIDNRRSLREVVGTDDFGWVADPKSIPNSLRTRYGLVHGQDGVTIDIRVPERIIIITSKDSLKYLDGTITLTFKIVDQRPKLSDVITDTDLGSILDVPAVFKKIEDDFGLVHGVDGITIEVHLLQRKVTITAKDSTKYQDGTIELTFRIL